jgi:hypothetical protein
MCCFKSINFSAERPGTTCHGRPKITDKRRWKHRPPWSAGASVRHPPVLEGALRIAPGRRLGTLGDPVNQQRLGQVGLCCENVKKLRKLRFNGYIYMDYGFEWLGNVGNPCHGWIILSNLWIMPKTHRVCMKMRQIPAKFIWDSPVTILDMLPYFGRPMIFL